MTRLGSTSANVWWEDVSGNPYVDRQHLSVCRVGGGGCVIDEDIPLGTHTQDVLGMTEGRLYRASVVVYAGNAPGAFSNCLETGHTDHLSSCLLTPNPAQIDIGTQASLTTQILNDVPYRVLYSRTNGTGQISISPASDLLTPFRTNATGLVDGTATVTNTVESLTGTTTYCTDSATVNVGNVPPPSSGLPWWQVVGGGVYAGNTGGGLSIRSEVPAGQYLFIPGSIGSVAALMRARRETSEEKNIREGL